jgi:hypothetical protein
MFMYYCIYMYDLQHKIETGNLCEEVELYKYFKLKTLCTLETATDSQNFI